MYERELKELERISQAVGNSPDITQGGGGNTSVKLDDRLMAVKASGFRLKDITSENGFVVVDYSKIKDYHMSVDLSEEKDYDTDSANFVKECIVEINGLKPLKPSVEAGFHSLLNKYVIHTHSVYANIICCAVNGKDLVDSIFKGRDISYIWIPYINPGFSLTMSILEGISDEKFNGRIPEVVFMENHGLIVSAGDMERCLSLHDEVNNRIKEYLGIDGSYPEILIEEAQGGFIGKTPYIAGFFRKNKPGAGFFDEIVLYPDQLVYLNGSIAVDNDESKASLDSETGETIYRTSLKEAYAIEETLLAYIYVLDKMKECGLKVKSMTDEEVGFILNWEGEKYRKKLMKEGK